MERITRFRAGILVLIFCLILGFFSLRLYKIQVIDTQGSKNNTSTYTTMTRVKAARGDILDRNGNVLVRNRAANNLVFNNFVILSAKDTNESLRQLVNLCDRMDIAYIEHFPVSMERPYKYELEKYSSEYQSYFKSYLTYMGDLDSDITAPLLMKSLRSAYGIPDEWSDLEARKVIGLRFEIALRNGSLSPLSNYVFIADATDEELAAVLELNTPGLSVEFTTVREYNTTYAAHVLGYVHPMEAEDWEKYKDIDGYAMDAVIGKEGIEAAFEEYLHGVDGTRIDEVTADGTMVASYYQKGEEPKAGNSVETTIDLNLQIVAEDSLARTHRELRSNPNPKADGADTEGAAAVVMDVRTGEVLVCASYPTFDPETMFEKYNEIEKADFQPFWNRALLSPYPPGSTFKMIMAIAGIESGQYSQYTTIYDEGVFNKYDGLELECLEYSSSGGAITHGEIDMRQALQKSCNYYFYVMGDSIDNEFSDNIAKQFGLGEHTGIELYEEIGHRANEKTKYELYQGSDAEWYAADRVLAAIGQSVHAYTPMQLCSYAATLANNGVRPKATFLKRVVSPDYRQLLVENKPQVLNKVEMSPESIECYRTGMEWVAQKEGGTAYRFFGDYPVPIAAKTGTAETGDITRSDHGVFLCYAPADKPEIAIAVYGEHAGHGSSMAGVAKDILDAYFDTDDSSAVISNENQLG